MKNLFIYLLLLTTVLYQSCMQSPSKTRKGALASSATTTPTKTINPPSFAVDEIFYWFTTTKVVGTITINKNSQDNIYLRGKLIHTFLSALDVNGVEQYRKQYCIVGNFASPTSYKQFRLRAVPIYVTTANSVIERLLRIDIPSSADNASTCQNTTIDTIAATSAVYSFPEICPTCTGQVSTSNINLYEVKKNVVTPTVLTLTKVDPTQLSMTAASIRIDLQSNATDPNANCSDSACAAKGFDCCISGQCVKDASEKNSAKSDPQYNQALVDFAINPASFINYPNIYYICANIAHIPPGNIIPTTPLSDAQKRVIQYASDWKCIADYTANGSNVFYVHKTINNILVSNIDGLDASLYTTVTCNDTYYKATKTKLSIACGCTSDPSQMDIKCPAWGIVPVYKTGALQTNENITDFTCYTPTPSNQMGPIINLNVSVPNRSAPHRFYATDGTSYDDLTGLQQTLPTLLQEKDPALLEDFSYLDQYNKMGPTNGSFNINSVLGKMTIDLSQTLPAKEVTVELGKSYILSAISGYVTPCFQCAKDSWFQIFSAHPSTQRGMGLQAVGYTTSRDSYSGNSTFGNYEDTQFGRACFVPITMLPLSHTKNTNLQTQRQNRLKTQTAFYVNGYQRDWFGFNQGSLIGSFDGVTWFAVGTGRRVTATSSKLFLALNASFLDLADRNDTVVNIIPDSSGNIAANYDYDPDIFLLDPHQNTGATCQKFHQCSVDTDCVTQLGWEYTCADISQLKTKWPLYDSDAKETVNQELTTSLFEILQHTISTTNGKRCIYRGAGAPCKKDYSGLPEYTQKAMICAPNFYCASLDANVFNDEIIRSPNEFDDILFGMDTNVLGRPLNYVTANKSLASAIIANIKSNAATLIGMTISGNATTTLNNINDMGICRPGRSFDGDYIKGHSAANAAKKTDYISQIGSCDSSLNGSARYTSCPAFGDDFNYADSTNSSISTFRETQNSCGAEARNINTPFASSFQTIEGLSLLANKHITSPLLAQDACLRRAGSVCHTDLDCGPNKLHEDSVGTLGLPYFGGTEAEQSYWKESLICGQEKSLPALGTYAYADYRLNDNRCCRAIGKDFTMYTSGPSNIVPENALGSNDKLITKLFPEATKGNQYRYSRYTISKNGKASLSTIPIIPIFPAVSASTEPVANQWQVIHETGSLTCCGGGWIRKFTDGGHDWSVRNRLSLDTNNFSCLNFRSPLADSTLSLTTLAGYGVQSASYQREFEFFCKDIGDMGCLQVIYPPVQNNFVMSPPTAYTLPSIAGDPIIGTATTIGYTRLDTSPTEDPIDGTTPWTQIVNTDIPYMPLPYYYSPFSYDVDTKTKKAFNFFTDKTFDYGVEMYLPAYIGWDGTIANTTFIKKVYIKYFYVDPISQTKVDITSNLASQASCDSVINAPATIPVNAISNNFWCITKTAKTDNRPVMIVRADSTGTWKYAGIIIEFKPIEQKLATPVAAPGNDLYYLTKLGRLELLGIPQITYEPLYCNNNQNNLVPGIFKTSAAAPFTTRAQFTVAATPTYTLDPIQRYNDDNNSATALDNTTSGGNNYGNVEKKFTFQDKIDHSAIFSSKDFTCCTPLGQVATSPTNCCSGKSVASPDGKSFICKLPSGTDLNVYFNKFVSGEGLGDSQPGGGLIVTIPTGGTAADLDFNQYTGEPKLRKSTMDKIEALGTSYCATDNVVTGGAFGYFPPEPSSGTYTLPAGDSRTLEQAFPYSIVDSLLDENGLDLTVGKTAFDNGFRWNHHYYCK